MRSHDAELEENEGRGSRTPSLQSRSCACNFWLFLVLKHSLRGKEFKTDDAAFVYCNYIQKLDQSEGA